MKRPQIALVFVGLLAMAGGGTALANRGGSPHSSMFSSTFGPRLVSTADAKGLHGPGDDLAAAAGYLGTTTDGLLAQLQSGKTLAQIADATSGKSSSGLIDALVAHEKTEIANAVAAGKLTQAQADEITATLTQRVTDLVNGKVQVHGPGFGFREGGDPLAAAVTYLGTTTDALRTQLESGKTLAQIADATSGKSASGLIGALVASEKTDIAKAVTAGKLTQAQADEITANLTQRVTDLVNGVRPSGGLRFGDHGSFGPGPGAPAGSTTGSSTF